MDYEMIFWAPQRKPFGGWRCFKSSPKAPQAPDPVATANAQSASNIATANAQATLNHSNQYTPWGSQIWTEGPKNSDGTAQWSSTISLDPAQQKLLDSSNSISQLMANLGIQQAGQVGNALSHPIDYNNLPGVSQALAGDKVNTSGIPAFQTNANYGQIQNGVQGGGPLQGSIANAGDIQDNIANAGQIQGSLGNQGAIGNSIANAGKIQTGINTSGTEDLTRNVGYGQIQNGIDMSGVGKMVGGDSLARAMQDSQGAAYRQQAAYLDPQYSQRQHDLENQLVQQGVTQNSDAWNRAMDELGRQRTFDYNNAYNNSFATGLAANNQLYNQGLSTNQNQYSQALGNANFANLAQSQGFNQGLANANINNSAASQLSAQRLAQQQATNAAQGQQYSQNANDAAFANSAQAQKYAQALGAGQFANTAQQQQYAQNANDMAQANSAQAQQFAQNQAQQQAANAAALQQFNQNLAQGQFANTSQEQGYNQAANNASLNNSVASNMFSQGLASSQLANQAAAQNFGQTSAARSQALQELLQQQQNPINILNALRSGSQINAPTFGNSPQGVIPATDIAGLYNNQYQGQLSAYNGQIAQNNSTTGALGQAAIAAAIAY